MVQISHSGGAVGATSILLMTFPPEINSEQQSQLNQNSIVPPLKGVTVAIITNLIDAPVSAAARDIASLFESIEI
jgi:hypothetical protein